jgi:hypothetical protein
MDRMGPTAEQVKTWILEIENELVEIDSAITPLIERQAAVTERLGLLRRLLASLSPAPGALRRGDDTDGQAATQSGGSVRDRVQAHALEILADAGRPLHINEIHAEFIKRGFEVPGAGKPNNITVHLSDALGIVSTTRGHYATSGSTQSKTDVRYPVIDESRKRAHG